MPQHSVVHSTVRTQITEKKKDFFVIKCLNDVLFVNRWIARDGPVRHPIRTPILRNYWFENVYFFYIAQIHCKRTMVENFDTNKQPKN